MANTAPVYISRRSSDLYGQIGETQVLDLNSVNDVLSTPFTAPGLCAFRFQVEQVSGTFGSVNLEPVISLDGTNWDTVPGQDTFIEANGVSRVYYLNAAAFVNLRVETARGAGSTANVTIFGTDACEVPQTITKAGKLGQAILTVGGTPQTIYQCPAGKMAIIDAIFIMTHGGQTNAVIGYLTLSGTTTSEQFFEASLGPKTDEIVAGGAGGLFRMAQGEFIAFKSDKSNETTITVLGIEIDAPAWL